MHALLIIEPRFASFSNVCGRPCAINTMTSAVTPSKPPPNQQLQMSQPQPSFQASATPASPPSRRADLKSWWKKFQVQPTRHQEARGKPSPSYLARSLDLIFIVIIHHPTSLCYASSTPVMCQILCYLSRARGLSFCAAETPDCTASQTRRSCSSTRG